MHAHLRLRLDHVVEVLLDRALQIGDVIKLEEELGRADMVRPNVGRLDDPLGAHCRLLHQRELGGVEREDLVPLHKFTERRPPREAFLPDPSGLQHASVSQLRPHKLRDKVLLLLVEIGLDATNEVRVARCHAVNELRERRLELRAQRRRLAVNLVPRLLGRLDHLAAASPRSRLFAGSDLSRCEHLATEDVGYKGDGRVLHELDNPASEVVAVLLQEVGGVVLDHARKVLDAKGRVSPGLLGLAVRVVADKGLLDLVDKTLVRSLWKGAFFVE
mmetsp:Transcript_16133/g.41824  ORF Transcript_16133/g.41824 Transcript_16133/m.41824 type:complete len:274 (-) Transcript_16133:2378-3199(-)